MTDAARRSLRLASNPEVRALQVRVNKAIVALDDATLTSLMPALLEARKALAAGIREWERREFARARLVTSAGDALAPRFTMAKYQELIAQLDTAIGAAKDLGKAMGRALMVGGKAGGIASVRDLERQVAVFSRAFGSPILLDIDTAAVLASARPILIERFAASAKRYGEQAIRDIKLQLEVGALTGETWMQTARRISKLSPMRGVPSPAPTAEGMAEGLWRRNLYRAERVVRTEMIAARADVTIEGLREWHREEPSAEQMQSEADDARTCAECADADGKIVPVGTNELPVHANCRGSYVPWMRAWDEAASGVMQAEDQEQAARAA
jgi:hypothetical protein